MRLKNLAFFAIPIGIISLFINGCSPKEQEVVATVGQDPITLKDYESLYLKGNTNHDSAAATNQQERERFLDLMVNYRLKLADARQEKLDQKPEIVNEVQQYKGGLAASFITEREVSTPGLRKLYQKRTEEVRASHILLMLRPDTNPEDSAKAFKKAYAIIDSAQKGIDFKTLAVNNSQDPSVKQNGGDLYYFTGGQMVAPFEDAVYSMKPGEITTKPVRTMYGLHIIKLMDRRPASGDIRASHIMIRFTSQKPTPEDTAAAYAKVKAVYDSLKQGVDYMALARRNSEDPGSASKGGDLGYFSRRRWVQPFDEVAFTLKPGQYSGIVRTPYGYHIIKCTDARPPKTFDEAKPELQQLFQQTAFQDDYKKLLDKLEAQVNVQRSLQTLKAFLAASDSTKAVKDSVATANVPPNVLKAELVKIGPISITMDSMLSTMRGRQDLLSTPLRTQPFTVNMEKVVEGLTWTVVADSLERVYPEFASILKEYKEGVLLYQVEQDNVWNRVAPTDSALHVYFDAHRDKFTWPDRVTFSDMRLPLEPIARTVAAQLKSGKTMEEIAIDDSVRMAKPTQFDGSFSKGTTALAAKSGSVLSTVAQELKADSTLKVQVTALPDTANAKSKKLADQRLTAISDQLRKLGVRADRIIRVTRPLAATPLVANATGKTKAVASKSKEADKFELSIVGRQPLLLGKIEQVTIAPNADDRAKVADSLTAGAVSNPFQSRSTWSIVRLDKREPARQKTFEEAGGELSSSFQEAESKRLETEWLQGLRQRYPVVEHKETLKDAFVAH